jgi:hypothetical protein
MQISKIASIQAFQESRFYLQPDSLRTQIVECHMNLLDRGWLALGTLLCSGINYIAGKGCRPLFHICDFCRQPTPHKPSPLEHQQMAKLWQISSPAQHRWQMQGRHLRQEREVMRHVLLGVLPSLYPAGLCLMILGWEVGDSEVTLIRILEK